MKMYGFPKIYALKAHMHLHTCTYTHMRTHTHTHARTHAHTHTHARTHTHTHTHFPDKAIYITRHALGLKNNTRN